MAISTTSIIPSNSTVSPKQKHVAELIVTLLAPVASRIESIHRDGIVHLIYSSKDYQAFDDRVEELIDLLVLSQRLNRDQIEPQDVRFLNHVASGLPINLYAAR